MGGGESTYVSRFPDLRDTLVLRVFFVQNPRDDLVLRCFFLSKIPEFTLFFAVCAVLRCFVPEAADLCDFRISEVILLGDGQKTSQDVGREISHAERNLSPSGLGAERN